MIGTNCVKMFMRKQAQRFQWFKMTGDLWATSQVADAGNCRSVIQRLNKRTMCSCLAKTTFGKEKDISSEWDPG